MKFLSGTRLYCFSFISSIETDFRELIYKCIGEDKSNIPSDVLINAKARYGISEKDDNLELDSLRELLNYIDFYDISKILRKICKHQDYLNAEDIESISKDFERMTPCRNRVCHSRPLEIDDLTELYDLSKKIISLGSGGWLWANVVGAISLYEDRSRAGLSLEIPNFWVGGRREVYNNLPIPEFDDTGFLGRDNDRKNIISLLKSNTKVVSIIGEGGIGKTALALKCLYDILEECEDEKNENPPFEIIVWVDLKVNRLTINGVQSIRDGISSATGIFHAVSKELGGQSQESMVTAIEDIFQYMEQFNILLCIDNLETIDGSEIRDFLANIPSGSKVLITTRIGLGEIEYRYKLEKLDDISSVKLLRSIAKLINVERIYKKSTGGLTDICKRLFNNPLLIKWYAMSIASGSLASDVLDRNGFAFGEALRFCFENIYSSLGKVEKEIISVVACVRKPITAGELRYLMAHYSDVEMGSALGYLHNSSMLKITTDSDGSNRSYSLTEIADQYVESMGFVDNETYKRVKEKRKELQVLVDNNADIISHHKYDWNAINWKTRDQKICAIHLTRALADMRRGLDENAKLQIDEAKKILPEFSENYRICARLYEKSQPYTAKREYEMAVEYDPNSTISRYCYSRFLAREEEYDEAIEQIDSAIRFDGGHPALITHKAWILTLKRDYKSATDLYENLLSSLSSIEQRKFVVSVYHQASGCYRRYSEIFIRDSDYKMSSFCLKRATEIIFSSVDVGVYDRKILEQFSEIFNEAVTYFKKFDDDEILSYILSELEKRLDKLSWYDKTSLVSDMKARLHYAPENIRGAFERLMAPFSGDEVVGEEGRLYGLVRNLICKTGSRQVSYGFLTDSNGVNRFFHRKELEPEDLLDFGHDFQLTFFPSVNEKGQIAKSVKKAKGCS